MSSDASDIVNALERILEEIQGFRSDFLEFTGYNTTKMADLASSIKGDTGYNIGDMMGPLGYNLGDLHTKLDEISSTLSLIDINTSS